MFSPRSSTLALGAMRSGRKCRIADMLSATQLRSDSPSEIQNASGAKPVEGSKCTINDRLAVLYCLENFLASLFATIMEDAIVELRLLCECNSSLRLMKVKADEKLLHAQKYSIVQPAVTDELAGLGPMDLEKEKYKLDKLASDRKYVGDSLLYTYLDLSLNKSYQALTEQISEIVDRDNYRAVLMHDEAINKVTRRDLQKQLRIKRNHMKSSNYDMDIIIERMKTQVEDTALISELRTRYTKQWEQARAEQHAAWIKSREHPEFDKIKVLKHKLVGEQRVHSEVTMLVHLEINEAMDKVEEIMNKYDEDIEAIDLKIQIMHNRYEGASEERQEMEEKYIKHEQEAKAWLDFKLKRDTERIHRENMHYAAVIAQAWWRGVLVRLQLGPYKPGKAQLVKVDEKNKKKKK